MIDDLPIALQGDDEIAGLIILESSSVLNAGNPLSSVLPSRDGLLVYRIQEGDNLSKIASYFGISLNTILWANKDLRANLIKPGQEIVILPISGVLHQVQEGETLTSIAGLYGVPPEKISKANNISNPNALVLGSRIVVPDAKPRRAITSSLTNLPNLNSYFALPTKGWNWGQLHANNAVDIANACGTPIYAAAEGLVIKAGGPTQWNDGYGGFIALEHPNGTETLYAHTEKNFVSVGDYINQRELIAEIGRSGNTHGPTGCHLHFEVKGAKNPLAK